MEMDSAELHPSAEAQRTRHIAGIAAWASARPRYQLRIGDSSIPFDALTDEAIAELRSRIATDVAWERRNNRQNRALYAALGAVELVAAE